MRTTKDGTTIPGTTKAERPSKDGAKREPEADTALSDPEKTPVSEMTPTSGGEAPSG